jgi:hypothetical protein
MNLKFWVSNQDGKIAPRKISAGRITMRKVKVSKWARDAQKCEEAIANIDKELSKLNGQFTRAKKELLSARRLVWEGKLTQALSHMNKEKSLLNRNVKHNQKLVARRLS